MANGTEQGFDARFIKLIRIFGGRGDDSIVLSPRLAIRASIEAGDGNDLVGGGAKDDTIFGQGGNDTLVGNAGNDYLDGGADNDSLRDYQGVNVLHGGGGDDSSFSDDWELGSGVENRHVDPRASAGRVTNGATDLIKRNGRLILVYSGFSPNTADEYTQSGPTTLSNGYYGVTSTILFSELFTGVGDFRQEWDVTDVASQGLIFTRIDGIENLEASGERFSIPFLMRT